MPQGRPKIPADIQRQVFFDAGRRCTVCGAESPLELAHIIPWSKVNEHKAENLVCLCANCHERSHKEKWKEKEIRMYKERPHILRMGDLFAPASLEAGAPSPSGTLVESQPVPSFDWFHIVYVNTRESDARHEDISNIRRWTWELSACVRWKEILPESIVTQLGEAKLALMDWTEKNSDKAEMAFNSIRVLHPRLPVLIVTSEYGQVEALDMLLDAEKCKGEIPTELAITAAEISEGGRIAEFFERLNVKLPRPEMTLGYDPDDLLMWEIIDGVGGKESFELMIQKFFPTAKLAGSETWRSDGEETMLCQALVSDQVYWLSFCDDAQSYLRELERHEAASQWLKSSAIILHKVPDIYNQLEAFDCRPWRYPLCFSTGLPSKQSWRTFAEIYRNKEEDFIKDAFTKLLQLWQASTAFEKKRQPPWGIEGESPFQWGPEMKMSLLSVLNQLEHYGKILYQYLGANADPWACAVNLKRLVYPYDNEIPKWLSQPCLVQLGDTHGYPVMQNCLVNPENEQEVRLIGCGNYDPRGRIVSDLALLECDIKFTLLATEEGAEGYFDLEVSLMKEWCEAETYSIEQRFACAMKTQPLAAKPSLARAYDLIELVRQRARACTPQSDHEQHHYFGALLYWTLFGLHNRRLHPTKQLLALHSASEILRVFSV